MKPIITIAAGCCMLFLFSCQQRLKSRAGAREDNLASLMQAERDASTRSAKEGFVRSMVAQMDDSGVLLRPNHMPAKGTDALTLLKGHPDTGYTLVWEPTEGRVAESGELGYTYGIWTLTVKATGKQEQGTYATVWRKDKDDKWRMMVDVGNSGLKKPVDTTAH